MAIGSSLWALPEREWGTALALAVGWMPVEVLTGTGEHVCLARLTQEGSRLGRHVFLEPL